MIRRLAPIACCAFLITAAVSFAQSPTAAAKKLPLALSVQYKDTTSTSCSTEAGMVRRKAIRRSAATGMVGDFTISNLMTTEVRMVLTEEQTPGCKGANRVH